MLEEWGRPSFLGFWVGPLSWDSGPAEGAQVGVYAYRNWVVEGSPGILGRQRVLSFRLGSAENPLCWDFWIGLLDFMGCLL